MALHREAATACGKRSACLRTPKRAKHSAKHEKPLSPKAGYQKAGFRQRLGTANAGYQVLTFHKRAYRTSGSPAAGLGYRISPSASALAYHYGLSLYGLLSTASHRRHHLGNKGTKHWSASGVRIGLSRCNERTRTQGSARRFPTPAAGGQDDLRRARRLAYNIPGVEWHRNHDAHGANRRVHRAWDNSSGVPFKTGHRPLKL